MMSESRGDDDLLLYFCILQICCVLYQRKIAIVYSFERDNFMDYLTRKLVN